MLQPQQNIVKLVESNDPCSAVYNKIAKLRLTEQQLQNNKFPRNSTTLGFAYLPSSLVAYDEKRRNCDRCKGFTFNLDEYNSSGCAKKCVYHSNSKTDQNNRYPCCKQLYRSPGCAKNYHVTGQIPYEDLKKFISAPVCDKNYEPTEEDVFALDCEMCFTTAGMELIRITVIDYEKNVVYDTLVKPANRVIDYNTVFTGITAEALRNVTCTLDDVQTKLCSMFHSKTILIGHSLDHDLVVLKLIHSMIVDTSVLYPHQKGPPFKSRLKKLCWDYLRKNIQNNVVRCTKRCSYLDRKDAAHSSSEDAKACIDLVLHRIGTR